MNSLYDPKNVVTGRGVWRARVVTLYILLLRRLRQQMVVPIVIFAVMTLVLGFAYAADRQILRQDADDPQIQMAKDAAAILGRGASTSAVTSAGRVIDVAESLAPFIIVYGDDGHVLQGSGKLDGDYPVPPRGVFNYVKNHGEDRVTWEPKKGLRIAAVVERVEGHATGFVLAGRSLAEVEKRERALFWQFFVVWVLGTLAILGGYFLRKRLRE